jgi:hypothetical protein
MAEASLDELDAAIFEGTGKTPADRVPFNDKNETFKVPHLKKTSMCVSHDVSKHLALSLG